MIGVDLFSGAGGMSLGAEWELEEGPPEMLGVPSDWLGAKSSGTLVIWDRIDRLQGAEATIDGFFAVADLVGQHLGMTFHRMISAKRVMLLINSTPIAPWDPLPAEFVDQIENERVGNGPTVRGCILPPPSTLTKEVERRLAGPADWLEQQGFYVYRGDRLIVGGGWMGLGRTGNPWRLDRKYNLARLSVDISNTDDAEWGLDVRKSSALPPEPLRVGIIRIAKRVRRRAAGRLRESTQPAATGTDRAKYGDAPIWIRHGDGATIQFRVNRRHPVVSELRKTLSEPDALRALLDILEKTVPVPAATAVVGPGLAALAAQQLEEADIRGLILTLYPTYRRTLKLSADLALAKLLSQPHLSKHENLIILTVAELERDTQGAA